jgi:hypothetical protein
MERVVWPKYFHSSHHSLQIPSKSLLAFSCTLSDAATVSAPGSSPYERSAGAL